MTTLKRPREQLSSSLPSSSPAFATPLHPIPAQNTSRPPLAPPSFKPTIPTVLPILLPPPTLRPLAFRTFTKKHNLTLNSSALQALASFIGRHCGSGWREEGTGEKVLEESAKLWKAEGGGVLVEDGEKLKGILKTLEGCMSGGRVGLVRTSSNLSSRQNSFTFGHGQDSAVDLLDDGSRRPRLGEEGRGSSFGLSRLQVESDGLEETEEDGNSSRDPRAWLKVISASQQPRFSYDVDNKHFIPLSNKPSPFPSASHKTTMFKERYNIIHQRLLRNSAFQTPSFTTMQSNKQLSRNGALITTGQQQDFYKITPIANLLGRGGSTHLLLGLLTIAPTGTLALNDPSGSISLSLHHASPVQGQDSSYYCPGMIVLIDGVYEDDFAGAGSSGLGGTGGVGGTTGGRFIGFSISTPPVEKRSVSLSVDLMASEVGGGFGWTDFWGVGSERAVGSRMRRLERRLLSPQDDGGARRKIVMLSEVTLDQPSTLLALRKLLTHYTTSPSSTSLPLAFLLCGNFTSLPAMAGLSSTDSIAYKEAFNELAAVLSDFPESLRRCTWIFVPGDNDPWNSAFSAGASTLIPRDGVPEVFTRRVMRTFASAKAEVGVKRGQDEVDGEAMWTSNPTRLSLFGPAHEVVVFRDDVLGRLRRSAVRVGQAVSKNGEEEDSAFAPADENRNGVIDEDVVMSGALPDVEDIIDVDAAPATQTTPGTLSNESKEDNTTTLAKRTILSLLPQSTLSPFPPTLRPVHWDHATASSALSLYPLPHTLVLADAEQKAWSLVYEGCCVVNPGRFVVGGGGERSKRMQWVEYDALSKRGEVMGEWVE